MKERFTICPHAILPDKMIVEYWRGKEFIARIYPHQDGLRICSKYMTNATMEPGYPPSAIIKLEVKNENN